MKLTYNTMPESIKIIPEGTTKKVYFHENIEESNDRYICDTYSIYVPADVDLSDENIQNLYLLMAKTQEETENRKKSINLLKNQLDSSDYKLLKCMESFMLSDVLPYDFSVLLSDRTLLRDKINAMQDGIDSISLDEVKCRKIVEMSAVSNVKITDGVDYNNEHFRLTMNDQISLTTLGSLAQSGQSVPYHADGKVCRIFSPDEMLGLVQTASQYIVYHKTYFNLLKHQILSMESIEEVESVTYGMGLNSEYQAILSGIMGDTNE